MMNELQVDGRSAPNWKTLPLGSFVTFQRGYDLPHRMRRAGGIPLVSSAGITDFHNVAMVNGPGVVTGRYGTIGELFYVEEPFWPLNTTLYVRDFQGNLPKYAYYLLQRFDFHSFSGKSGVPGVNRNDLHSETVKISNDLEEQSAIATALTDVDALIAGLEKLIAKKRDLKQAAMQQLLTGQTRLPGFSGEWVSRPLGSLGTIYGGLVGKSKTDFGHGSASYVPFVNVMANIRIDCGALEPVNVSSAENQNRVLFGDLLFNGSSETPEEVALCALMTQTVENLYLNSFCFGFRFKQGAEASGLFLTYLMRSQMGRELMKSLAQGSTRYNLSKSALLQAILVLPSLEEQTAIATALSDMDANLVSLQGRFAKTRELKQGMMQELLTGKTRLN